MAFALLGPRFQDMSFDAVAHHQDVPKGDMVAPWGMGWLPQIRKQGPAVVDNDSCAAAVITHADNPERRNTASGTREMSHDRG